MTYWLIVTAITSLSELIFCGKSFLARVGVRLCGPGRAASGGGQECELRAYTCRLRHPVEKFLCTQRVVYQWPA